MSSANFIGSRFNCARLLPRSIRAMRVISIVGIAIAVAALIIANSVGRGFEASYRRALMDFNAHLVVMGAGDSSSYSDIKQKIAEIGDRLSILGETPFLYREALSIAGGKIRGVVVKGIDPATIRDVNSMTIELPAGEADLAHALLPGEKNEIPVIMGRALARDLGIIESGVRLKLLIPREGGDQMKGSRFDEVRVAGFFESGLNDYDAQFLLISLAGAWRLFGMGKDAITGIELKLADPNKAGETAAMVKTLIGPRYDAISWDELNRDLISAVRLEKLVSSLIMGIMVAVATLNIVAVIVLTAIHRVRELAILKAIGFKDKDVAWLLIRGGAAIGARGVLSGLIAGISIAWIASRFRLVPLDAEVYLIGALPIDISWVVCAMIALFCFTAGVLTSAVVARSLAGAPVAEGLRGAR